MSLLETVKKLPKMLHPAISARELWFSLVWCDQRHRDYVMACVFFRIFYVIRPFWCVCGVDLRGV